jgi:hypothetical protein
METVVGFKSQVRRLLPQIVLGSICLYRSTTASGENALLLTIYSLAIGCQSKPVEPGGDSELAQGSLPFNKYYHQRFAHDFYDSCLTHISLV